MKYLKYQLMCKFQIRPDWLYFHHLIAYVSSSHVASVRVGALKTFPLGGLPIAVATINCLCIQIILSSNQFCYFFVSVILHMYYIHSKYVTF
jgi:hypothetical protein